MGQFSRWMPPKVARDSGRSRPVAWLVLTTLAVAFVAGLVFSPTFRYIVAGLVAAGFLESTLRERRMRALAAERRGESICTFARAFDRHAVDPWVIRATYEELTPWANFRGGSLPLRASDRLEKELGIDSEDLDELACDVAQRAGRSLNGAERNPLYGRVLTVGDLVRFVTFQPRRDAA